MAADNSSCSNPDGHFQDDTNIDRGFGDSPLKHMLEGDDPVCSVQEKNGKSIQEKIEPFIQYHEPLIHHIQNEREVLALQFSYCQI